MLVGESLWRSFPASATLDRATRAIQHEPGITRRAQTDCGRCDDAEVRHWTPDREELNMAIYTGTHYRDGNISIGPPDVTAIRRSQEAGIWDLSSDPTMGDWLDTAREQKNVHYFSIYCQDALVGQILLHDIDDSAGVSLVGYHIFDPRSRGLGIGTTALRLLQRFVIEETDLARLIAITSTENVASRRIAEKCGFIHAGAPREDPLGVLMEWRATRAQR